MTGNQGETCPHMSRVFLQWPFQEPIDWRYLPYIGPMFSAYGSGDMPPKHGQKYGTNVPQF